MDEHLQQRNAHLNFCIFSEEQLRYASHVRNAGNEKENKTVKWRTIKTDVNHTSNESTCIGMQHDASLSQVPEASQVQVFIRQNWFKVSVLI